MGIGGVLWKNKKGEEMNGLPKRNRGELVGRLTGWWVEIIDGCITTLKKNMGASSVQYSTFSTSLRQSASESSQRVML